MNKYPPIAITTDDFYYLAEHLCSSRRQIETAKKQKEKAGAGPK
jgi:hypothetical protein